MSNPTIKAHADAAAAYDRLQNEGAEGFNPHLAKHDAAVAEVVKERIASIAARFPEVRAAWNAAVAKYTVNGQVPTKDLAKIEAEVGITQNELILAKKSLGL